MRYLNPGLAKRILLIQAATTLGFGVGAFGFSAVAGLSALIGGGTASIANALFSYWMFGGNRRQGPGELAIRVYGGEVFKILVIIMAFAAAFMLVKPLNLWVIIGVFLVVHLLASVLAIQGGGDSGNNNNPDR